MAYIEWDYTIITSMVETQGWNLPDRDTEEWKRFNDELAERMRGVGLVFEKYCMACCNRLLNGCLFISIIPKLLSTFKKC